MQETSLTSTQGNIEKLLSSNLKGVQRLRDVLLRTPPSRLLVYFDNDEKLGAFFLIQHLLTYQEKLQCFREAWTSAEFNFKYINECRAFFKKYGREIMNEEELTYFNSLPSAITLYRGTRISLDVDQGISYTSNRDIAEMFIKGVRFKYFELMNGRTIPFEENLITRRVNKQDICCYINSRNESEFIVL